MPLLDPETRRFIAHVRQQHKAYLNHTRTMLALFTELDERLANLDAQPLEAQRNGSNREKLAAVR